ncbi:hypothetical protein [Natrialba asiatica]|uniref:Uncharacterized protein n=1 Tax=Natrialba asiatica (strain ATCC 700177 / DSM 12278 / JCM 9576 / FERM P-10747 / NBRC 102637 / 172P1) TaxID=29540 RepID=M0AR57_NATA1|nr:hypothetical protein [Natrialba asiatica]ELZ00995.1 hypothetical protein C481_10870 [Natrialba asiatica DSM 12278]
MERLRIAHTIRTSSYALALFLVGVIPGSIVLGSIVGFFGWSLAGLPIDGETATIIVFVVVPALLPLSLVARAVVGGSAAEQVFGALSVPCLCVPLWAGYSSVAASGIVGLGGIISFGAGVFLALIVLADAVIEWRLAGPGATVQRSG